MPKPIDHSIAGEAINLVTGDRQNAYGHPRTNFQETADLWSVVLGTKVTPQQVALCMVQVKLARELHKPKRDNLVDAIGYLLAYDACTDETVTPPTLLACLCDSGCSYCEKVNHAN
jgi:hypothetical protein